ncbi:MAG: hypothetical protein M0Z75_09715 [Nitrospiraceae bacterium]|nr:hypothetical protein [Nitrospiraceae bacterium]
MKRIILIIAVILLLPAVYVRAENYVDHTQYANLKLKYCAQCHQAEGVPANHDSMWVTTHRLYAEKKPSNCKDCHQLSFCLDCHTGGGLTPDLQVSNFGVDYTPKSHRTDFIEIHPIKALDDPRSCYRCHDAKSFCEDCHNKFPRATLNLVSHREGFSDLEVSAVGPKHATFTPSQCQTCHPNSVLPQNVWAEDHAREARTNLESCQTCHPDGNVCLKCHSAMTGLKIDPHPRGWSGTLDSAGHILHANGFAGRLQSAAGNRTCVKCH